jgi:hypothetical protein
MCLTRAIFFPFTLLSCIAFGWPSGAATVEQNDRIAFIQHEGHFERNDSGLKGNKSFLAFDQLEKYEAVFGTAALGLGPTKKQNFVTPETFDERMVLATIYRGTSEPTISNISIRMEKGTIVVRYKLRPGRDAGFAMNVPLILSIPKTEYQKIEFYENDKLVGTVKHAEINQASTDEKNDSKP